MNLTRDPLLAALRSATDPRGLQPHEIAATIGGDDPKIKHRLRPLLAQLLDENLVEKAEGGRYRLVGWRPAAPPAPPVPVADRAPRRRDARVVASGVAGRIRVHPAGYGFVERDDREDDVFVAARNRGGALDGDRVTLDTWMGFKGTEAGSPRCSSAAAPGSPASYVMGATPATAATSRPTTRASRATWRSHGGPGGAREGQCVVAEIVDYPTEPEGKLTARVVHVLGDPDDPRTEVAKTIACAEIPDQFPRPCWPRRSASRRRWCPRTSWIASTCATATSSPSIPRPRATSTTRCAWRTAPGRGWSGCGWRWRTCRTTCGRAPRSTGEARLRGVSVYLPNRAISMLPHELSAGICSLNPEVDRCAMVVRLDIDATGNVVDAHYLAALIRSKGRLDYAGVAAALAGDLRGPRAAYEPTCLTCAACRRSRTSCARCARRAARSTSTCPRRR